MVASVDIGHLRPHQVRLLMGRLALLAGVGNLR